MYLWERNDWPEFRWDSEQLLTLLALARRDQGRLMGKLSHLGFGELQRAQAELLVEEALGTSEIEGERLDTESVRSSVARRLGIDHAGLTVEDRRADGLVEMLVDATQRYDEKLTKARLCGWHAALFPTGYSGMRKIKVGGWRSGPMRVVSGSAGRERVHFEAPPAERVPAEMKRFLAWFDNTGKPDRMDGILCAGLAHLWFLTLHPFEDGNGRVGRAIADLALSQDERLGRRFHSLSAQIVKDRAGYYEAIEAAQRGDLDITAWLIWFLGCYQFSLAAADNLLDGVLFKVRVWQRIRDDDLHLNPRQRKMLNRLLDDWQGNITTRKWVQLTKASEPTARRDIAEMVRLGLLVRNPGGSKKTSYRLAEF